MIDLLGTSSILIVCLIYILIALRLPNIANIIIVALIARILVLLISYSFSLPDTGADSNRFEVDAWSIVQHEYPNILFDIPVFNSKFYSFFISIPYSLFGRSILMAKSMSLFFGMGLVILSWLIAKKLFNNLVAKRVWWIVALFPTLILYSVITM